MDNGISCVYMIQNEINNRVYIGSTKDLKNRMNRHLSILRNGKHDSDKLQKDWNEFGQSNFKLYILEIVTQEDLLIREQFFMNKYNSFSDKGYNLHPKAGSPLGYKHREDVRQKYSESRRDEMNGFYNKKHTKESKDKMSKSHLGKTINENQKRGLEEGRGKKHFTEETYKKLSEKNRGEGSATSKLTEKEVIEILGHLKCRTKSWKEISLTYNVSLSQISRIKNGKRWGYLKEIRGDLYE
ncbi:GIY-YIG nuclease family protein [Bacillus subtilis]|uniref:Endonuclease n=1 Tax=Bacillus phage vB_BsuS_PJN02 TaxID=2920374 RepID=A0AC61TTC7_9CAUD|nr:MULTISPECIES: GIY-YIG nuclease family protein [Bacillus subtilis group]YP_010681711.1 homing endonuclease [Bacillus phage vB_BsuS_PJN02]MCR4362018.1 GIY-YIG nuclease family protein [Bacillus subtilis]UNH58436.1 endonuclease [Bacillus phage vB_BsuS_PJN02]UQB84364.1 GIY-YIG nuclease family protein [Bacillus amyloliquefaciens]WOF33002.1 GIY-YIG nuclease family protein [Bacillus subtilis]